VFAALPVDNQLDTLIANETGYDLFDQEPNQTLLGSIISRRIGPGFGKAPGKSEQALPVRHRLSVRLAFELFQPTIKFSHPR